MRGGLPGFIISAKSSTVPAEQALNKYELNFLNWYIHIRCIDYLSGTKIYCNYSSFYMSYSCYSVTRNELLVNLCNVKVPAQ